MPACPFPAKTTCPNFLPWSPRIAEGPFNDFRPSPGKITSFHTAKGHGVRVGHPRIRGLIPPYYNSMIAKLIVRARTREEVLAKMERALENSSSKA